MDLSALNPMQKLAAQTLEGPVLIIAGAGSGKTRTMTYRMANLLEHEVPAYQILALTFTNKAAKEMKERIEALVGQNAGEAWIGTFHAVCVRILRRDIEKIGYQRSFLIYDDDDQGRVLKDILKQMNLDEKYYPIRELRSIISDAKNKMQTPDEWFTLQEKDMRKQKQHDIFTLYEQKLKKANALDFDDIINRTLELLLNHPPVLQYYRQKFRYVHVDEYQDTNLAQYTLIKLLTKESRNLCVVGDDDQSIYGWRGADIRNILDFQKDFPEAKVIKLEQNYRSTDVILNASNALIANNEGRMQKSLWTELKGGELIRKYRAGDEREEAAWVCERIRRLHSLYQVPYQQVAVLYRMHAQSRVMEEMLMRAGIPYAVYGGTRFYDRKEIKDALAYLRLIVNPLDEISLKRIINVPKRAIGDATVALLEEDAAQRNLPLYSVLNDLPADMPSRPAKCVQAFAALLNKLHFFKETMSFLEFVENMLNETGLLQQYQDTLDEELIAKKENLLEFLSAVKEFQEKADEPTLEAFLENVALVTDLDRQEESQRITMMTLHSAKGLEFDAVFMMGLENGIFPSYRSMEDENRMEEERRLCYVGMTRARKYLHLSLSHRRLLFNQVQNNEPSCFLSEIPQELITDQWGDAMRKHFGHRDEGRSASVSEQIKQQRRSFGAPGIGQDRVLSIPGVQKGLVSSNAHEVEQAAEVFKVGDRVLHRKFGEGTVKAMDGRGADCRITIFFTAYGEKQFALAIAPIAKLE